MLAAGTMGNTMNALFHMSEGHRSIGASTAVFAAVGILAAVQTITDWGKRRERHRFGFVEIAAPVVGGLTLLGMLGAGKGNTDVWAHGFGFLSGLLVGAAVALWQRQRQRKPSAWAQGAALLLSIGLVAGAWGLAVL
jgi:membrane associated rhomboid family serine protease